jgi:peroxiredoxin
MIKKLTAVLCFFAFSSVIAFCQDDPKAILEKCFRKCINLEGGSYQLDVSKKSFNDQSPAAVSAACRFLKVEGDSSSPYKFFVKLSNDDGTLCTSNELVQLKGSDSTGIIYSRSSNQSMYRGAFQSEGLFPPFFQPEVVFSLDRLDQTTFIVRMGKDEQALGKPCYNIKLIDLIRASLPDGQRQEKTFLIDKETLLPIAYSERSVMKLNNDSVYKENKFRLKEFTAAVPHDSLFTFKNIPDHFRLRNILENVYHHHLKTGMAAPDFKGKIPGGDSISLKSFSGKKVLLFFFYRSSYPSLKALNEIQQFQNENKDVVVLLIGIDASETNLSTLLSRRNISVKAIEDGQPIADKYFISTVPSFISIDEKGIIKKIENGFSEEQHVKF